MANKASAVHEAILRHPAISLDVLIDLGLSKTRTQEQERRYRKLASFLNVNVKSLKAENRRLH